MQYIAKKGAPKEPPLEKKVIEKVVKAKEESKVVVKEPKKYFKNNIWNFEYYV